MASDWRQRKVSEVCTGLFDGPHATPAESDTGPIFLRIENIERSGRLNFSAIRRINEADFPRWTRRVKPQEDDIVFSYEANLGLFCRVPAGFHGCLGRRLALVRPDKTRVVPAYLLYAFLSPTFQELLRQRTVLGSTVDRISLKEFPSYEIPLPPLAEQRAIANILGVLDDKIELNRRMNETLEGLARAIFQSWFVDFDPVRAQRDGLPPPALSPATAALFPDSFEDSELGKIPKGWTVEPVGGVVECVGGGTPSTTEPKFWEGGTHHWTTPKDFSSLQSPVLLDTDRKITDAGVAKISSGLLPTGTVLLSSRAPVGYLAIAAIPVAINQGFIAIKCNARASNFFMLNWCQANMIEIESRATGTTFAEISKQNFRPILVVLPPKELMAGFTAKVAPLYDKITTNVRQSAQLAAIRDALLPKLLSGEIRVAEAERLVEDAG